MCPQVAICGWIMFGKCSIQISAEAPAILTEVIRDFRQSLQEIAWILHQLGHDRLLASNFQLTSHILSYHLTLYTFDTENVVK
jgi:hypothetical protein